MTRLLTCPLSTALGVLGTPGLTAFVGLLDICDPQPGETVVVSGAAGAVGMIAGQIAKIKECRVVGLTSSEVEVAWSLDDLGFDAALNYGIVTGLDTRLEELWPGGFDVYLDDVGGSVTDAVMRQINTGARICLCGQMSQDNLEQPELGPRWLDQLIAKQARVQGLLVSAHAERFPDALRHLGRWLSEGKLKYREEIADGIEAAPQAFVGVLRGQNEGRQLVRLSDR